MIRKSMPFALALLLIVVGCGDDSTKPSVGANDSTNVATNQSTANNTNPNSSTANNTSPNNTSPNSSTANNTSPNSSTANNTSPNNTSPNDDPGPSLKICNQGCETPSDCGDPGSPGTDADNYVCTDGACEFIGCNSDDECSATVPGNICAAATDVIPWPHCTAGCSAPEDCDRGLGTLFDTDNYECLAGACEFTGCNTTEECVGSYGEGWVCHDSGVGLKTCLAECSTVADCASPQLAYDADNYTCEDGVCLYQGCNDDAECQDLNEELVCLDSPF